MPSKPKKKSGARPLRQYGAVPYRIVEGGVRVLLVTSRETGRWLVPKGHPMKGRKPHRAAAIEAFEEAGVKGKIARKALGTFASTKVVGTKALTCLVSVYPLRVREELDVWPEAGQRIRAWVEPGEAAGMVREPGLAAILRSFSTAFSAAA